MERSRWTDDRLDDLALEMRRGFDRVDAGLRDLRSDLTAQIDGLRQRMIRIGGGMIAGMSVGFLSVITAILARGV